MDILFEVKGLDAWYTKDKKILQQLDLDIHSNQIIGLLGLNGAGKTTFLNVLSGLHNDYDAKKIKYNQKDVKLRDNQFKKERYIVFSEDDSFGYFNFDEYIRYVFKTYKKDFDKDYVDELVHKFNFENYRAVMIKDLSMGNRRKAYLITGFALKTKLLLLDEPVNGLDFQSTEVLYELIIDYRKYGTVLFSSHVLESVTLTSDKVIILEKGNITKSFDKENINPANIRSSLDFEN